MRKEVLVCDKCGKIIKTGEYYYRLSGCDSAAYGEPESCRSCLDRELQRIFSDAGLVHLVMEEKDLFITRKLELKK